MKEAQAFLFLNKNFSYLFFKNLFTNLAPYVIITS